MYSISFLTLHESVLIKNVGLPLDGHLPCVRDATFPFPCPHQQMLATLAARGVAVESRDHDDVIPSFRYPPPSIPPQHASIHLLSRCCL